MKLSADEMAEQNSQASTSAPSGFTLLECMIVLAIISLLAAITVPSMIRARTTSQMNDCIGNLRQVDAAVQQWAIENNAGVGTPITKLNIRPYLGRGSSGSIQSVFCPADTTKQFDNSYTISDTGTKPACAVVPSSHLLK
jgi:prepilin-type N-terminal cleavage/methylation domain-containing protein